MPLPIDPNSVYKWGDSGSWDIFWRSFEIVFLQEGKRAGERLFISYLWGIKAEMEPIKCKLTMFWRVRPILNLQTPYRIWCLLVLLFSCVSYFSLHIESDFFCSFCAKDVICGAILFLCIKDVPVNCYQCVLEKCRSKENSKGKFSVTVITVRGEPKSNLKGCFFTLLSSSWRIDESVQSQG